MQEARVRRWELGTASLGNQRMVIQLECADSQPTVLCMSDRPQADCATSVGGQRASFGRGRCGAEERMILAMRSTGS